MNILFLSAWCPWPADNGSKLRIYHLLRGLAQNHTIDLVSFCPNHPTTEQKQHLQTICRVVDLLHESPFVSDTWKRLVGFFSLTPRSMVGNFSQSMANHVQQKVQTSKYDLVIASQMHMIPYALLAHKTPKVLEELELAQLYEQYKREKHPLRRLRSGLTWWKTRLYVSNMLKHFAGVTVVSQAEQALVAACSASLPIDQQPKIAVVPNGVDLAHYNNVFGAPEPDTLIYPGALSYDANFDAVAHFINDIQPLINQEQPGTRLRVTGRTTPDKLAVLPSNAGVEFTGHLADVRPAVAQAWAEVVPLRKGGGTRLKVLEALALGTPVISTPKGVEGLELVPGRDVLVADTAQSFAEQTLHLLRSPTLRQQLADNGRRAVARYDWSASVEALERLMVHVVPKV